MISYRLPLQALLHGEAHCFFLVRNQIQTSLFPYLITHTHGETQAEPACQVTEPHCSPLLDAQARGVRKELYKDEFQQQHLESALESFFLKMSKKESS